MSCQEINQSHFEKIHNSKVIYEINNNSGDDDRDDKK